MESLSRFYTGSFLLGITYASYINLHAFICYISLTFFFSFRELLLLPTKKQQTAKLILLVNYLCAVNIIYNLKSHRELTRIIIYNSFSDIIQYIVGRSIGRIKPFSFTSKSLEGYLAGIILPQVLFQYERYFIFLNIIGMTGGMVSSMLKRNIHLKHWSNFLGHHGGINDRLDSICAPIIIYLNFIK